MSRISATVMFCDDFRLEMGGKSSIIGLYRGFLGIGAGQPFLPKLVALVLLQYPRSAQGTSIRVVLEDRGAPLLEASFDLIPGVDLQPEFAAVDDAHMVYLNAPLELAAYSPAPGAKLRVRIDADDFSFTSDTLTIVRPDRSEDSATASK